MNTIDMVTAALSGDKEAFQSAFNDVIVNKVSDALEIKKVEVASTLITPEEETNEPETTEIEIDGSESSDRSTETAS